MNDACESAVRRENTKYHQREFELPYGSMFSKSLLKQKDLEHLGKSLFFNKDLAKKSAKSLFFNKDLTCHGKSLFFNKDLAKGHQTEFHIYHMYFAIWSSCVA